MEGKDSPKKARILIVDDEEGARESLEMILEDDYDILSAQDGLSAIECFKNHEFDLVMLDMYMPKLNGIETLKKIKLEDKSIDVIIVSAVDRAREAAAAMRTGAYDYITKPFDPDAILTTVERALQKRLMEKELRYLRSEVGRRAETTQIISQAKSMDDVFNMVHHNLAYFG